MIIMILLLRYLIAGSPPSARMRVCASAARTHFCVSACLRPVHLLRVFLLRVLESNFPGDSLSNSMDMIVPTP